MKISFQQFNADKNFKIQLREGEIAQNINARAPPELNGVGRGRNLGETSGFVQSVGVSIAKDTNVRISHAHIDFLVEVFFSPEKLTCRSLLCYFPSENASRKESEEVGGVHELSSSACHEVRLDFVIRFSLL